MAAALAIITHRLVRTDGQGRVNLAVAEAALGHFGRVHVIAADIDPALAGHAGVVWHRVGHGPLPGAFLRNAWFALASRMAARALPAGTVVLSNGAASLMPAQANAVHFVHGAWARSPWYAAPRGPRGWYQRAYTCYNAWAERRALAHARAVIAVSPLVADELAGIGVPRDRITVIANGVDAASFHPASGDADRAARRADLGLPTDGCLALFAGDIATERKNWRSVLAAIRDSGPDRPGIRLAVVGDASRSPAPALARAWGIDARVHFLGFRRDMPAVMRAADLFVFPSRHDPFGLVIAEAMASGVPVITARTCGAAALVVPPGDAPAGIVLDDPDDVVALATSLDRLAGDAGLRNAMGAAGRARALEQGWDAVGQRYAAVLKGLAS